MGSFFKKALGIVAPIVGTMIAPGIGTALGSTLAPAALSGIGAAAGGAVGGAAQGKGLKGIALGAASGYAGNAIGSSLGASLGKTLGTAGGTSIGSMTAANAIGPYSVGNLGSSLLNTAGNTLANATVANTLGQYAGNALASNTLNSLAGVDDDEKISGPSPFQPTREAQANLPGGLSGYDALTPEQQSTNLATQGVYGGGLGPEEQRYFLNMINRRLVDESGQVDQDMSEINPIEQSFLAQLGLGGNSNSRSLLEAMSKWKAAA